MIFEKKLDTQKLIEMIKLFFENFFNSFCAGDKTWNDQSNYFILKVNIQQQLNVEFEI